MADRKVLAVVASIGAALMVGWAGWNWLRAPLDPGQLFRKRCSSCHELTDLSPFESGQIKGLVRTMRKQNGADKVISDAEADVIGAYLEEMARK